MADSLAKHKRIKLSQKKYIELKLKVYERDKGCVLCPKDGFEMHHVIFRSHGGSDTMENCVMLCHDCHEIAHGVDARDIKTVLLQYLEAVNDD